MGQCRLRHAPYAFVGGGNTKTARRESLGMSIAGVAQLNVHRRLLGLRVALHPNGPHLHARFGDGSQSNGYGSCLLQVGLLQPNLHTHRRIMESHP